MVLTWLIRMRPLATPEAAYRSAAHWYLLVSLVPMIVLEGFFLYGGILMVRTPGQTGGGLLFITVSGAAGVVTVALLSSIARPRHRREPPPAVRDGDGLRLPVRRLPILAHRVGLVAFSGTGILLIINPTSPVDPIIGVAAVIFLAGLLALSLLVSPGIGIGPHGITLPHWDPTGRYLAWEDIDRVEALGNFHPHLAVTLRGDAKPVTCTLHYHAWPPSAVLAAVQHFAEHASLQRTLTDPAALERFRTWPRVR